MSESFARPFRLPPASRAISSILRRFWCYGAVAAALCAGPLDSVRAAEPIPGYTVVPISLMAESNQAVIKVTLNDQPAFLILDTGASSTVLDSKFYKVLDAKAGGNSESKLPPELQHKTMTANGEKVGIGYVNSLKVGSADFGGRPVTVADFARQFDTYNSRHPGGRVVGLLGEDILRKYSAIIDWRRRGVYFNLDPSKRLKLGPGLVAAGWTAIPLTTTDARHFAAACTVEGKPVRLVVDTGATFTGFDSKAITLKNTMYNRSTGGSIGHLDVNRMNMSMLGMDSTAYMARLENWKIGNYVVPQSVVLTSHMAPGLTTTGGEGGPIVGLLGAEVLASNNALLDVAGSTLYLKAPPEGKKSGR